ncbi:hypothetical protein CWI38_0738p0030 [Hamiltosporidium tvaerminnensis]|uniref:Uncharacterized protein n=1 Tax=Hamiltosporidium tvaerminnensis TaxID=1176355 RepID=A0A4Q9LPJ0_9MICR|nr:hypothetical protein CWI38_1833p0020 [Hamiltosporidium tvaerminnensis]TBU12484.1 hypothetical protein CWI38_0738p0030 [Hamiltosporidium tvaerminnensis]
MNIKVKVYIYLLILILVTYYHFKENFNQEIEKEKIEMKKYFNEKVRKLNTNFVLENDNFKRIQVKIVKSYNRTNPELFIEYYNLIKIMINNLEYFNKKEIKKLLNGNFTEEKYFLAKKRIVYLKNNIDSFSKTIFLVYSWEYNLGIFLPVFLPILINVKRLIKK